ncbi:hypothetical protein [Kaarinaea lacus]
MNNDPKMPGSIVDAQVQRLLEIVEAYRKQQCDALITQAKQDSQHIVRQAYREARVRMRQDIQDSREHMRNELSSARAKLHTLMMQQRHEADQRFLEQSWNLLAAKLQARWQQPKQRQAWVQKIVLNAGKMVPGKDWLVEHPKDWTSDEQKKLRSQVNNKFTGKLKFKNATDISAGIRIVTDGAVIDGSLQGLMANRIDIESIFLAQCRECIIHSQK